MPLLTDEHSEPGGELRRFLDLCRKHLRRGILRNASWMLCGRGFQLVGRVTYFVIVAHALGPAGYGLYVACTAFIAAMSPFAVVGTADVITKYAARDRSMLPAYFGNALLVTAVFSVALTGVALLARPVVLPAGVTATMLIVVAIAELFGTQMTAVCAQVFLTTEEGHLYAHLLTWTTALRVLAALALMFTGRTPLHWAYLYASAGLIATIGSIIATCRYCASPRFQPALFLPSLREGIHFATASATQTVYNDIDKVMLSRLASVEAAAIYSVAFRFIDAAMLPIYSVAAATYPEFFRRGLSGVTSAFAFARNFIRRSLLYGISTAACLFIASGVVPMIMGRAYAESTSVLRWLSILMVLKSVHAFLTDTLTGADHQWQRSTAQAVVAGFSVLLNLCFIPIFAWRGAALSSVMTNSLLVCLLYGVIRWHVRRERASAEATSQQRLCAAEGE